MSSGPSPVRFRHILADGVLRGDGVEEAARLLEAAPGLKHTAALGVAYGAGLRVSEVAHLKVDDVDLAHMLLRVEQAARIATPPIRFPAAVTPSPISAAVQNPHSHRL